MGEYHSIVQWACFIYCRVDYCNILHITSCSLCVLVFYWCFYCVPSVLWHCWLGGRKGIRPVKNWVVRCWHGYLSGVRCRLACAQLMPLPHSVSCSSKIQIDLPFWYRLTWVVPDNVPLNGCVCVCLLHNRSFLQIWTCVCLYRGLSPAEAELRYLMNANKLALYGVDLHVAKVSRHYIVL